MGVAGAGKTTVGQRLAAALGWPFEEGDRFHPAANVAKMRRGQPLNDRDRAPWLAALRQCIEQRQVAGESAVMACSALKQVYRAGLRGNDDAVRFVYLKADPALLRSRLRQRQGHFMGADLLESQWAALEEPQDAVTVSAHQDVEAIVAQILRSLGMT